MGFLTRDEILKADDLKTEDVNVPEWGGTVRIKTLTGNERDEYEFRMVGSNGQDRDENIRKIRSYLLCAVLVDEAGNLMFPAINDIERIGQKSSKALQRVFDRAAAMNGLNKEDVESLAKNSDSGQSGDSGSSSAANSDTPA
jgi:hypothetical protein